MTVTTDTYSLSTNFTFTESEIEFSSSTAKLAKSALSGDEKLVALFYDTVNADRATSSVTGTITGAMAISGNKLTLLNGVSAGYLDFAIANFTNADQGTIRFRYTPDYSGTPSGDRVLFDIAPASGNNNRIKVLHATGSGVLALSLFSSTGGEINIFGAWSPVSGTEYLISLDWKTTATAYTQLCVNGVPLATSTATQTRTLTGLTMFRIGASQAGTELFDGAIRYFEYFSTRQKSADFSADLPISVYRYPVSAGKKIVPNSSFRADGLESVESSFTTEDSGFLKYTVSIDDVEKYWNGSAWVTSSSYSQTNTESEIDTNLSSIDIAIEADVKIIPWLVSSDGITSPILTSITTTHNFAQETISLDVCRVYGQVRDLNNLPIEGATVVFTCTSFFKDGVLVSSKSVTATTDEDGEWEIDVVVTAGTSGSVTITTNYPSSLELDPYIQTGMAIPNQGTAEHSTLVAAV